MSARVRAHSSRVLEAAEIVDLSHDGRGVARVAGKAVFIQDALPGEKVEWSRLKRNRDFDEGRLARVVETSAHRIEPHCAHFGVCGGCVLQHLTPPMQLEFKQRQLVEALTRIGQVIPGSILPALRADSWNYRRRARLAARWVPKKQRTVVGFRERNTPFIADLRGCEVLAAPVDRLIEPLSLLITSLSVRARVPQIEVAVADNATALVIRVLDPITPADRDALSAFEASYGVEIYLQPGGYETIAPLGPTSTTLEYRMPRYGLTLQFQPTDFVQVNGALNLLMIERAIEMLDPRAGDQLLDLFCGLGNFSLPLARSGAMVTGVEGDANLVARAQANATRNELANVKFLAANLFEATSFDAQWVKTSYDKVLLDPPRAGAREVLPFIAQSGANKVLYISCHPGSLARDAGILVHEHGYKLESAGVMDMFPHTAHVESIAMFVRGSG